MRCITKQITLLAIFITCLISTGWTQTEKENKSMNRIESGFIQVNNGRLFYERTGAGEPIVFIHDGLVHRETWNHQFPAWADRFSLIRYDRRGFGKSSAPTTEFSNTDDLLAVMDSLGIEKAALIGLSAGSRLAIDFTLEHQERVNLLILCGAVVSGLPFTNHMIMRGGRLNSDIWADTTILYKYWMEEDPYEVYPPNTEARAEMVALLKANPINFGQLRALLVMQPRRPAINFLSEIKVPTLIVTGEFDIADVHAHSGAIAAGIQGAERIIVNNAGHRVPMEQPEIFNEIVMNFLSESSFFQTLYQSGAEKAAEMFHAERKKNPEAAFFSENRMNQVGYQYLLSGKVSYAVQLFKLNVEAFPGSANVYDSYGEALLMAGDTTGARQNYEKSLELNPNNTNATAVLGRLHGGEK